MREEDTGASKGFGFLRYEDGRSAILAVDNMNGTEILGRMIRVDHKDRYTAPLKKKEEREAMAERGEKEDLSWRAGRAYEGKELANNFNISTGVNVFDKSRSTFDEPVVSSDEGEEEGGEREEKRLRKKRKKEEKREKKEKKEAKRLKLAYDEMIEKRKQEALQKIAEGGEDQATSWRGRVAPVVANSGSRNDDKFRR